MTQEAAVRACRRPGVLRMDFQPIVDTARGTVVGYEALARFSGPPQATPDRWFAVARTAGFGTELEAQALRVALKAQAALPRNCFLSVNIGPDALTSSAVASVLAVAGDLRGVVIEITEQTAVACYDALVTALAPARAAGASLAVDDAGAGFASLRHLVGLRPSIIKLDITLIRGIDGDGVRQSLAGSLVSFGKSAGAEILAEGVETAGELKTVRTLGIRFAQGFLLGRPEPPGRVPNLAA